MVLFTGLPYELVSEIVSNLSTSDLASTSRVSQLFHSVSERYLYATPQLVSNTRAIENFLRTVLVPGNESLATRVNSLSLVSPDPGSKDRRKVRQMSFTSRRRMNQFSRNTAPVTNTISQDVLIVQLLQLLPHLQVLQLGNLDTKDEFHNFITACHSVLPANMPVSLKSLREFRCGRTNGIGGITVNTLLMLLGLPLIHTIDVHIIDGIVTPTKVNPKSKVSNISLSYDNKRTASLGTILGRLQAVERLSYTIANSYIVSHSISFRQALQPLKATLQYLRLDCTTLSEINHGNGNDDTRTIGSLRDWPVLRTLISSLLPLLGTCLIQLPPPLVGMLPECLCKLEILEDRYWSTIDAIRHLRNVLAEKEAMVPGLEMMAVRGAARRPAGIDVCLKPACAVAGVELVNDTSEW